MKTLVTLSSLQWLGARAQSSCSLGFSVSFEGKCSYSALLSAYEEQVSDPLVTSCQGTLLDYLGNPDDPEARVRELCLEAVEPMVALPSQVEVGPGGEEWTKAYYDGGTDWNEEVETELGEEDLVHEPGGSTKNVLRSDADNVKITYEHAQRYRMEYLEQLSNFESCEMNSVMCCWPQDRQANDNNGNCAKPYDTNCVDKDPADNTDLCMVHMDRDPSGLGGEGFTAYPGDNGGGEGPIHCHGFAWSNDPLDKESRYMGNNLFYVSMYDHMRQRGYARNIPGSPMCACVEQMPVVTRSDCTQTDVTQTYVFSYEHSTSQFKVAVENISVDFNSCQGLNNRNNDLSAYVARLVTEDKITKSQQNKLRDHLVENGNCPRAIERNLASKGVVRGFAKGDKTTFPFTNEFPETETEQFVHGICVTGASNAIAFSSNNHVLEYESVDFVEGVKAWGDRSYVYSGVEGSVCEGGVLLRPSHHKTIAPYTDIAVGMDPIDDSAKMCVLLFSGDVRHGRWPEKLFYQGFTKDLGLEEDSLRMQVGNELIRIETHCKTVHPPDAQPPLPPNRVMDAVEETYIQDGKYKDNNYDKTGEMVLKNDRNSNYDRSGLIKFDVDASFLQSDYVILRLYVQNVGTDASRTVTVSRLAETFDAMAITHRAMNDATVVDRGPSFAIIPAQKGTWIEVGVTDLVKSLNDTHIVFRLDLLDRGGTQSYMMFGTSDLDKTPQLIMADGTTANVLAHQDGYVRDGTYNQVRYGLDDSIEVKNDSNAKYDRKGLVRFDLSGYELSASTTAVLRLHVKSIGSETFRAITVSKLNDPDLDLHAVSWSTLDTSQVTVGEEVSIHTSMAGHWIDFLVTDLLQSATPIEAVVFLLENKGAAKSQGWVHFDTLEGNVNLAPQLILDALDSVAVTTSFPSASPSETPYPTATINEFVIPAIQDAFLRGGIYQYSNFGSDPVLLLRKDGRNDDSRDYDRKSILEFDTSRINFQTSSSTLKLWVEDISGGDCPVTISRLVWSEWDEKLVTWSSFDVVKMNTAPVFTVKTSDKESYVEIPIDSLLAETPSTSLVLLLENRSNGSFLTFASRESDHPPHVVSERVVA